MIYAIAVGGNRGEVPATLRRAAEMLCHDALVQVQAQSPLFRTAPVGCPPGEGDFLNGVWLLHSGLGPHQLLDRLQQVEQACGRVRSQPWGGRTCDLDLLLRQDGLVVHSPVLTLPHPRLHDRAFVLEPLAAVAREWSHPLLGCSVGELWRRKQETRS